MIWGFNKKKEIESHKNGYGNKRLKKKKNIEK